MEKIHNLKLEKTALHQDEAFKKLPHLFEPLGVEKIDKNGNTVIENDLIRIKLKYEEINLNIFPMPQKEQDFLESSLNIDERALIKFLNFCPETYYVLKNFQIENKSNGSKINLQDELGENIVYVKKNGGDLNESGAHFIRKMIRTNIEPKSPAGILIMFHEIGHKKDPSVDVIKLLLNEFESQEDSDKETMEKERNAWAYSLIKLRPYLKGLNISKEDIDIFIHKWALGSYSNSIDTRINPTITDDATEKLIIKLLKLIDKQNENNL